MKTSQQTSLSEEAEVKLSKSQVDIEYKDIDEIMA